METLLYEVRNYYSFFFDKSLIQLFGNPSAKYDNQVHTLRLPPIDNLDGLETYLELLCEDLGCCDKFISTVSNASCSKCRPCPDDELSIKNDIVSKRRSTGILSK